MSIIQKSVIDLLNFLSYDEESRFLPQSKSFNYKKIGKATISKEVEESYKVDFNIVYDNNGYSFEHITFARDKANVSLRVQYNGIAILPKNEFGLTSIKTFIYRAYSIITDGKLNITTLPVIPSERLINYLTENKITFMSDINTEIPNTIIIDLSSLAVGIDFDFPTCTAARLVLLEMELLHLQASRKYLKSLFSEPSGTFKQTEEVENWLKSLGITSYSGFVQKSESIESENKETYQIKTLKTKISSLSNLPTVDAVNKKIESGKPLTPSESVMATAMKTFDDYASKQLKSITIESIYKSVRKELIFQQEKEIDYEIKSKLFQISQIVFHVLVTGKWFNDKKDFNDNTLEFDFNGKTLTATFELSQETIEL